MNNARRNKLRKINDDIRNIIGRLDYIVFEEQNALDSIPENLQMTDSYFKIESAIESMDEAMDNLNDAIENIETAIE